MRMKVDGCDSVDGGVGVAEVVTALEQLSPLRSLIRNALLN